MKVAVSASGMDMDCEMDPRFGRCSHFILVDSDTIDFETINNPNRGIQGGAGIGAAQILVDKGVGAVITGSVGPNAYRVLSAAGIQMYTSMSGRIRALIEMYKSGSLHPAVETQPGRGKGVNCGLGQGKGRGRGMGRVSQF
jgi:predicted Fe-Mo cluster-binding NifX family protein